MAMGALPPGAGFRRVLGLGLRIGILAMALRPVSVSGDIAGAREERTTGVAITRNVPFVRESIGDIRALAPERHPSGRGDRAVPFHRLAGRGAPVGSGAAYAPFRAPETTSGVAYGNRSVPSAEPSFVGLVNPPPSAGDVIPPDTMGAAGPYHLVSLLNSDFGVFDKATGGLLDTLDLQVFWSSLGTGAGQPAHFPFDTKVLYDQHSGRFVAITLGGTTAGSSYILLAVSSPDVPSPSDPLVWNKWAIPADLDNTTWADYPALGLDASNVYVGANMFNNSETYQYSKVWLLPKPQLLSGTNPVTWTEFRDPPGSDFDMQPAHTFGTPGVEYFVYEGDGKHIMVTWIDNVSSAPVWNLSPIAVPVTPYDSLNLLPGAPQRDNDNTIDTADTRLLNAVFRNGSVWTTHHVLGNGGRVEVAWYRIDPAANSGRGAVVFQGRVGDSSRWHYYPSIAVNKDNVAAIGFTGSSPTEYAGAYYTVIRPGTGAADPVTLLKAGEAPYYKTLRGQENRWGDYSATVVDPTDDTSFWTLQEYAQKPDSGAPLRSRWGTWWGKFPPGEAPPPPSSGGGGGGGGCLSISRPPPGGSDGSSVVSLCILFLPAVFARWKSFSRGRNRH